MFSQCIRWITVALFLATVSLPCRAAVSEGLAGLFPDGLLDGKGDKVSPDVLDGKVVGVYFSASWCGPCQKFTPELVKYHARNKDRFEIVFVSSDRTEDDQFAYMKKAGMDWPAVKHNSDAAKALKEKYEVRGIPTLVMVRGDGETITREGRAMVNQDVPAGKLATAKIVQEEYKCPDCDKVHTRAKVVYGEDPK